MAWSQLACDWGQPWSPLALGFSALPEVPVCLCCCQAQWHCQCYIFVLQRIAVQQEPGSLFAVGPPSHCHVKWLVASLFGNGFWHWPTAISLILSSHCQKSCLQKPQFSYLITIKNVYSSYCNFRTLYWISFGNLIYFFHLSWDSQLVRKVLHFIPFVWSMKNGKPVLCVGIARTIVLDQCVCVFTIKYVWHTSWQAENSCIIILLLSL